jgi:hypothetical protein
MSYYNYENIEHYGMYLCGKVLSYTQPLINTYTKPKFEINEVYNNVFIGDFASACNYEELQKCGITHIVTVIVGVGKMYPHLFTYHVIDICDRTYTNIKLHFDNCSDFIDSAIKSEGKVLIHCQKGVSRSATIVAAYLIKKQNFTTDDALAKIKSVRDCINPNDGFIEQLREYELCNKKNSS